MSFQPRSSRLAPDCAPKPWGRMAGRAAPLRARSPEEREAKGFGSATLVSPLLADNAAAEAADRTRTGRSHAGRCTGRREHRPAELLFKAVGDVIPQLDHFAGRAA